MQLFHEETCVSIDAPPEQVFEYLDDHRNLSSHMDESSWMMAGSRMDIELDRDNGRKVGSRIRLNGTVLGVKLAVDEAVIERDVPRRKSWRTLGEPRLLVIGPYQMGFEIAPRDEASDLRVFIDYELPAAKSLRWLRRMLALFYARWCTRRMAHDAAHNLSTQGDRHATQGGIMTHKTDPLDARAFGLAAGAVAALLVIVCSAAVAIAPEPTTAFAGYMIHADLTGFSRTLTWTSFVVGLLFWSIGTAIVCAAGGALYNRIARRMIIQPGIRGAAQG